MQRFIAAEDFECHFLVIDDCSTDGTYEAVTEEFPYVEIIRTSGDAYWAGAMRFGWEYISTRAQEFDAILAFNDDIDLNLHELAKNVSLIKRVYENMDIFVGQFSDLDRQISYGLNVRKSRWHPLRFGLHYFSNQSEERFNECVANFNFIIIPREIIQTIGFLKPYLVHKGADFEFSLRALKSGYGFVASNGFIGTCERNTAVGSSRETGISLMERWRRLTGAKEEVVSMRYKYYSEYAGALWPLLFLLPYVSLPFKHIRAKCF
jgi:GT2 family glycosyltransferase